MTPLEWVHLPNNDSEPACEAMACKNRVFVSTRVEAAKLLPSSVAPATELLDTTTKPAVDSLSPRRRSGEGQGEGISKERATIRWNEPLSPALSPLVPRREREQVTPAMVGVSRCARTLQSGGRLIRGARVNDVADPRTEQSQRDCGLQPKVGVQRLPWVRVRKSNQRQRRCG